MEQQQHKQLQLIDAQREYHDVVAEVIGETKISPDSEKYNIISVIGTQNSGKSTLLNYLFGTNFDVLTKTAGQRTTNGIWLSVDKELPYLIMDVEGNDAQARSNEDNRNFEKTVAMYALTLSHALIVNIRTQSFGTFEGSQYSILTTVMEIGIKLFKHESAKVILFCLRDFNPKVDNLQYMCNQLHVDLTKIWEGIKKPAQYAKHNYDKFFKLEVQPMRKFKKVDTSQFEEDIAKLRKRFVDPSDTGYFFKDFDSSFNLPLKDLPQLSRSAWDAIIHEKEFNLPGEKEQVSNFRCQAIKDEVLHSFEEKLGQLNQHDAHIGEKINELIEAATAQYNSKAATYDKKVAKTIELEVKSGVMSRVETKLDNMAQNFKDALVEEFEKSTETLPVSEGSTLNELLNSMETTVVHKFEAKLKQFKHVFPLKNEMIKSLENQLSTKVKTIKDREGAMLKNDADSNMSRAVSHKITDLMGEFDEDFWSKAMAGFEKISEQTISQYVKKFHWIFGYDPEVTQTQTMKSTMYNNFKNEIRGKLQLALGDKVYESFSKKFFKDESGMTRNWSVLTETDISKFFDDARDNSLVIINKINQIPNINESSMIGEEVSEELFETAKVTQMTEESEKKMTDEYERIIRSKKQAQLSKVPWYLWVIFVFFMYDDIWFGEDYPYIYYPLMFLLSFIGLFFAIGHTDQLFSVFEYILTKLKARFEFLR